MAEVDEKSALARSAALARLELEAPVHELARPAVDEWAVRRMWEGIQHKRALPPHGERRYVVALALFAALASVLALVIAGVQLVRSPEPASEQAATALPGESSSEPLLTREAQRFEVLEAPPVGARDANPSAAPGPVDTVRAVPARVDFADGSSIEATPGTRVEALASKPGEFAVAVRRGRAQFRVTPGGPRRWRIEASHAEVEVLGTVLWVESDATGTSVRVDVGSVLVRSPELPGGSQPVAAGELLRLGEAPRARPPDKMPGELEPPADERPQQQAEPRPARAASERSRASASMRTPARSRAGRATAAAALWEQADEARRGGQPARAAALLARLVEHYPADSQVALAAFTLGVLQLERLERPVEAAASFQLALELCIGAALREDAYLRWAEALARVRDHARLRMVSAEYARLYPRGRQRAAIERLVQAALAAAEQRPSPLGAVPPSPDP